MRLRTIRSWFLGLFRRPDPEAQPTGHPYRGQMTSRVVMPRSAPILPVRRVDDNSLLYAPVPAAVLAAQKNYLQQVGVRLDDGHGRADNLLDGLIGTSYGLSGGGWTNTVTGHGDFNRDKVLQGNFQEPYRLSDPELSALYNGNDIAKRIVDTVPREMFRRGWQLVVPQDEDAPDEAELNGEDPDGGEEAAELEQPMGGESGPAAPGSPLVDPMGASPDNATAKVPDSEAGKTPQSNETPSPKGAGTNVAPDVAPAANGANVTPDPMGEALAKPAQKADPEQGDREIKPASDPKSAGPSALKPPKKPGAPGSDVPGATDQPDGADLAKQAEAYASRLSLKPRVLEACIFGRAYGGGILIVGADDGQDMSQPLKEDEIKTIRYLAWIDRRFVFANTWYADIGPKYGEVATWQIVNPFGGQSNTIVHETRVIRFDGAPVDFLMRRRLLGWTLSVLQAPYDTMRQFDMSFQSIANLMSDLSQAVMSINGLAQLISNDQTTLNTRMKMVDMSRSSSRMLYIDAENEKFERMATPLTGVADTLEMQMLRLAAGAEMPVAILFGREPSGLNATGDADFRRFYDVIKGKQLTELEPKLRRLYTLIFAAKDGPTGGQVPKQGVEFIWHKLYEPSEKEQSEIRWNMAQADEKYITNKVALPEEIAMSRFRNGDLHLDTEIKTDLRKQSLATAELPFTGKAADDAQAQQAKDLAEHSANVQGQADIATKGAPMGKDPNKAPAPGKPGGAKKPPPTK